MGNLSTTNRRQRTRNDCLSNRKQRTRIRNSFSDCFFILGALQGSMLGALVFNIFSLIFSLERCGYCQFG